MNAQLKLITVKPDKPEVLRWYQDQLRQAIESALKTFDPPSIEDGERAAKSESRGMGPLNGI